MPELNSKNSSAIVAVSDIERAKRFYRDTLGLKLADEAMGDAIGFRTGDTWLTVYKSDFAGTNKANAVSFDCGEDLDDIVADLASKGVRFEQYDMEGVEFRDGIHHAGGMKMVWFKDPDGNILHLLNT